MRYKATVDMRRVQRAQQRANERCLKRTGAYVRSIARRSLKSKSATKKQLEAAAGEDEKKWARARAAIREKQQGSPPGTPPYTRGSHRLKNAIVFHATAKNVIIGPTANVADDVGSTHEFGKPRFGRKYPKRPFMGPAMLRARSGLAKIWKDSVR